MKMLWPGCHTWVARPKPVAVDQDEAAKSPFCSALFLKRQTPRTLARQLPFSLGKKPPGGAKGQPRSFSFRKPARFSAGASARYSTTTITVDTTLFTKVTPPAILVSTLASEASCPKMYTLRK